MKKISLLGTLAAATLAFSCTGTPYGLDPKLAADLYANIAAAGDNGRELTAAMERAPEEQREGMAYLIAYMPEGDRDTLTADFLLGEVEWAYRARETFPWAKALPDSVFYNDVLPYASMNERREPWRAMFWEKLYPLVERMIDVRQAIDTINKQLQHLVGVEYNTKRRKPHQSPGESMEIGMASCSGLSILLTDAFRTMGIPSRIAGTPLWVSKEGNHNWTELWIDGKWYFTEYYPTPALNHSWFLERAGKADKSDPIYWMYATSWRPTGLHFPMVWDFDNRNVPGIDVTDFYIDLYNAQMAEAKNGAPVIIRAFRDRNGGRDSEDRAACDIRITDAEGNMVAAGKTAGPTADMNDYLTLYLPFGKDLTAEFTDNAGQVQRVSFVTPKEADNGELQPVEVELFLH
ncbi:transglutaminase-like domain-containing protein [uncultured Rikenella sp.]|uniref:transglutaminase-like domain-containing protein n=1 Tax=uncultured Rikenella sp. TaxID=368003 RepID=UPI0025CB8C4D|nr:transglutaminase-like domain-containing protein [uncultured Rikenella sp.]